MLLRVEAANERLPIVSSHLRTALLQKVSDETAEENEWGCTGKSDMRFVTR